MRATAQPTEIGDVRSGGGTTARVAKEAPKDAALGGGDVFAAYADHTVADGPELRGLLISVRGYVPLRKEFVQLRRGRTDRASVLAKLVGARQLRALQALLLAHAMEPTLRSDPYLPLATWATLLSTPTRSCNTRQASEALNALAHRNLLERSDRGTSAKVELLREDGTGEPWVPAGTDDDVGPGFFTVPHELFTSGLMDQLNLPGLAMLLLGLHDTNQHPVFTVPVEKVRGWYGFSERTAERGYRELEVAGVMRAHRQMVRDPRSPIGLRPEYHRTLLGPYETQVRKDSQKSARRSARRRAKGTAR
jgi:hypothetical protein